MKFLLIISVFSVSLSSQTIYLLPDEYDNVIHHLSKIVDNAKKSVFILSHEINNYELKKSLLEASKRDVQILLITAPNNQRKYLALYKNIQLRILNPIQNSINNGKIAISLIIIDNILTCKLSSALETRQMKHNIDIFTCKDDSELAYAIQNTVSILIERSKPYLEN